jgi:3-hydroxyisobutyrate dehydrogenase-like beta-hydroxyacid dehydrogenase
MTRNIGFVGLGNMGLPISQRLLGAGHRVIGHDAREDMRAQFTASGGEWAESPRLVADRAEVVLVCLSTPAAVEAVALGPEGLLHGKAMKLYIDLSTTGPQMAKRVAERLAANGVVAFDAPVSGGIHGGVVDAGAGTLTLMAAGPSASFAEVRELLECIGRKIFYVGEQAGMGHLMKLLNNLMSTTAMAVTYEAMTVGAKAGLDPQTMLDVLSVSSGTNHAVEKKIPKYVLPGVPIGFSLDLSYKDVSLCVEAGEALQVPMRMGRTTCQIWHHALCKGDPKQDYLQVVKLFEEWGGVSWTPPVSRPAEPT